MSRSFWPGILAIDNPTWDDRQNLKFSGLLVLKIGSLLGCLIIFSKVFGAMVRQPDMRPVNWVQTVMLLMMIYVHLASRNLEAVRRGGVILLVSLTAGLVISIVSSADPYLSGGYHYVSATLLFAGFLLGIRYAVGLAALYILLYASLGLDLWGFGPAPSQIFVDRISELLIVTLFVSLYHRLKERQYRIIAEQERANVQKEKLLSINRMAGGIAHEINNPLAIVMGYIEIMSNQDQQKPLDRRVLSRITSACERIASIVDSILKLTRDGGSRLEEIDLFESCRMYCEDLRREPNFHRVHWQLDVERLSFPLPAGYWDLILSSILKNAFEAASAQSMPEIHVSSEARGPLLLLVISDNGPHFDESEIPNFFEPLYTSKVEAPGRGMGLSIAYVLAMRLGWTIDMRRDGKWTRVTLRILLQAESNVTPILQAK